jgi:hypothetical protein
LLRQLVRDCFKKKQKYLAVILCSPVQLAAVEKQIAAAVAEAQRKAQEAADAAASTKAPPTQTVARAANAAPPSSTSPSLEVLEASVKRVPKKRGVQEAPATRQPKAKKPPSPPAVVHVALENLPTATVYDGALPMEARARALFQCWMWMAQSSAKKPKKMPRDVMADRFLEYVFSVLHKQGLLSVDSEALMAVCGFTCEPCVPRVPPPPLACPWTPPASSSVMQHGDSVLIGGNGLSSLSPLARFLESMEMAAARPDLVRKDTHRVLTALVEELPTIAPASVVDWIVELFERVSILHFCKACFSRFNFSRRSPGRFPNAFWLLCPTHVMAILLCCCSARAIMVASRLQPTLANLGR